MIDWLNDRRDPAALGTAVLFLTAGWWGLQHLPAAVSTAPVSNEVKVQWEDLPAPTPAEPTLPAPPRPALEVPPTSAGQPPAPAPAAPVLSPNATEVATGPTSTAPVAPAAPPAPATPPAPAAAPATAPPAPPAPAPAPRAHASAEQGYASQLRGYLNSIKRYPNSREARQLRPTGTVRVWLELSRNGQLQGAGIENSGGSSLLDVEALRTVRGGRYPAMPDDAYPGQASNRFVIAIDYTLDD